MERWIACKPNFCLPVRLLSKLFRRLMLEKLKAAHARWTASAVIRNRHIMSKGAPIRIDNAVRPSPLVINRPACPISAKTVRSELRAVPPRRGRRSSTW